jgi:hypothetical protein
MAYTIEIAVDHVEGAKFCAWLNAHGHQASVGRTTGNSVDGVSTNDAEANDILTALWDEYCGGGGE